MKNVTLSADEHLILGSYAHPENAVAEFDAVMERLRYARPGRTFTRNEMNER